ncbi:P22 coat - protein 5 family protein [Gilliamella apicola]|uniref:P22 phage major capsid protein family protein n=1 Tax=Gilliamella apicola TaxID=1196095 RepID=UPI000A35068D|nr:P22 phage major capsid protein family protein [Gilliamella apicola]OTP90497.1 P22 coat - protein 5 family protein [Gilliamella apicola]OTP93764.1 P22 coat - protein 5 family protein [Gilliamella apicola]OTQ00731.1 P22 coat - protein 5 family protein [Gilliamella apicola]OTQ05731.1 P22 coat - protein 5 family protein [Gilliamella apicola]OTQ30426.1 P22 coat - protein 5 family protein [Gilliamella apicola]
MANTLTNLIPTIYTAVDKVSREQTGFLTAVGRDAKADGAAVGQTVTSHVTSATKLVDIEPSATAPNDGDQNIGTVNVTITKSKMAPIKWNGEEQLAVGPTGQYNKILADQFAQGFRALANEIDADLGGLFIGTSRAVGKARTTPFAQKDDLSDFADALKVLEDNGAPNSDLQMVLGSDATSKIRGKQSVLFKNNEAGTDELLREGIIGRVEGFNLHTSGGVKRFKGGNAAGYLVNGAKKEGERFIAVDTGTGKFKSGDVVSFAGDDNQYVVAATAAGSITLNEPGLRQNLADNTAITVAGDYVANMAFDRSALLLACRTPAMPEGGDQADDVMDVTDPHSGITFQVALYRQYRQVRFEVGLAWGVKSIAPRHAALILG